MRRFINLCTLIPCTLLFLCGVASTVVAQTVQYSNVNPLVPGHTGLWIAPGAITDAGGAQGGPAGLSPTEFSLTQPTSSSTLGPNGENFDMWSAPIGSARNYLGFSPKATIGGITATWIFAGQQGGAAVLPILCDVNGTVSPCLGATSGLLEVGSNTALKATAIGTAPWVLRAAFSTAGDATPQWYYASSSSCSLNSGAGDNGSQVQATGGCWIAAFGAGGADIREWGVVADNTTDNTTTAQQAFNWLVTNNGKLLWPSGKIYWATGPSVNLPVGASVTIQGTGQDASYLRSGATGMTFTRSSGDQTASIHIRDLTLLTSGANASTGISYQQTGSISNPALGAPSDFTNVSLRGNDNFAATECWANGISTNYVSNIAFNGVFYLGCAGSPPTGSGVNLAGGSSNGVEYNFNGSTFVIAGTGIVYGQGIQGVAIVNGNFTGGNYGIHVPSGGTSISQLSVTNSQFGVNNIDIYDQSGVIPTNIIGNYFYMPTNGDTGIEAVPNGFAATGNMFFGNGSPTNIIGMSFTSGGFGGVATGNTFTDMNTGITEASGAGTVTTGLNNFANVTTRVTSASTAQINYQGPAGLPAITAVSGAVAGAGSLTELTVGTTSGFTNGQVVLIAGVGGVSACAMADTVIAQIQVVDSTHLLVSNCTFSGVYTSGGTVSAAQ